MELRLPRGATIRVIDFPSLDLTTPEGRGFLALFSAMAERERIRIVKRTQEGRRLAIEAGKRMGRKPKLTSIRSDSEAISARPPGERREHPTHRKGFCNPSRDNYTAALGKGRQRGNPSARVRQARCVVEPARAHYARERRESAKVGY